MVQHIIVILSLVQCLASNNNNNNTYATILYYSTPLKSNVQQIFRKQMGEIGLTA